MSRTLPCCSLPSYATASGRKVWRLWLALVSYRTLAQPSRPNLWICLRCTRLCRKRTPTCAWWISDHQNPGGQRIDIAIWITLAYLHLGRCNQACASLIHRSCKGQQSNLHQPQHAHVRSSPAGIGRSARAVDDSAPAQQDIRRRRRARDHGDQARAAEVPLERRGAITRSEGRHPTSVQRRRHAPATKNVTATRRGPRAARRDLDGRDHAIVRGVPVRRSVKNELEPDVVVKMASS